MQISIQETAEQYADTAKTLLQELQVQDVPREQSDVAPATAPDANFSWPATVNFTGGPGLKVQICCSSQPPIKAATNITAPVGGVSSGTCLFKVPASQLPSLGELTIEINMALSAISIAFFNGTNVIGAFAGNGLVVPGVLAGKCAFQNGTC